MAVIWIARRSVIDTKHYISASYALPKPFHCRLKSTTLHPDSSVNSAQNGAAQPNPPRQTDPLDLTFENSKDAYKSKTTWEIFRAIVVLKLSTIDFLVENHQMASLCKAVLGSKLFNWMMRHTFYGHFVAGENTKSIRPTLERLRSFGVKSILDYSAEEDMSEDQAKEAMQRATIAHKIEKSESGDLKQYKPYKEFADRRKYKAKARTYFYLSEAQCEKNMDTFLRCIDAVAGTTQSTGFAAIKLTALGRPQLLMQLSEVIARTRQYFKEVTGAQTENMVAASVSPTVIASKLEYHNIKVDNEEVKNWLQNMDYDRKGLMNMFSWSGLVDMNYVMSDLFKVPNLQSGRMELIIAALNNEEEEMFRNMMRRLHNIARSAREKDVRVMIDAEQSYFQPAINRITMEMMRKYNKQKAIVFNTYQCYLKEAYNNVVLDLNLAKRQGFYFGAKLVRGAYMEQERIRAQEIGYPDPINPTYEATSEMYHKTLSEVLRQIHEDLTASAEKKIGVMVASHNEDTVRFTVKKMEELGIKPEHKVVCFGQLLGMCDQVSFLLGQAGYSVYKYVPYGPIDEVLPYLSRRALENHGILKKVDKELNLLRKELIRRMLTGQIFYKPKGNYVPA
ncbi:proline dehydrogenase 1, mitochondrial-like [Uloborus diversus]|uniref:proline dehydrogenase 1, mitochondrial-like n=1 Tax=Uloborus diversus TaxID=327109 RepID=UPI0024095523|nr:proline dehydrogenase 1, mitochondrial-like [Uloborus diversus]